MRLWFSLLALACLAPVALAAPVDPCSGPDQTIDLQQEMPPIDDQGQSVWCATYAAKSLLDYNTHEVCVKSGRADCDYAPSNLTSAAAVHVFSPAGGGDPFEILKGAQYGSIAMQSAQPPDPSRVGGDSALLGRLTDYYLAEELRVESQGAASDSCPCSTGGFEDLLRQIPGIQKAADRAIESGGDENTRLASFLDSVLPRQAVPAFNLFQFETTNKSELIPHIVDTLTRLHQPLTAAVCSTQLDAAVGMAALNVSWFPDGGDGCGAHAVTVIGFRKQGGVCQIHIRNSYGDRWPYSAKNPDGNAWIDARTYLSILLSDGSNSYWMTNIRPRRPNEQPVTSVYASGMPIEFDNAGDARNHDPSYFTGEVSGNGLPICGILTQGARRSCVSNGDEDFSNMRCCKLSTGEYPQ